MTEVAETRDASVEERALEEIIADRTTRAIYQPIVDLDTEAIVGWEALARGPEGSPLEFPDRLFATAARFGRTAELDHCCRVAAVIGAIAAGLGRLQELFVNVEPDTAGAPVPKFLESARDRAQHELRATVELTERALTADPAGLLALVAMYRRRGWAIALDDVGVDPRSVGLMPLLQPDVIKLDMSFVQEPMTRDRAVTAHAVIAEAERSGALVLAEGIENAEHAAIARTLGADLGQGWHFGRPGDLVPGPETAAMRRSRPASPVSDDTAFEQITKVRRVRTGTKRQLLQMSLVLEDQALQQGTSAVLLSTFQEARYFSESTRVRYTMLAQRLAFVGALAHNLASEPAPGVRGAPLDEADMLRGEWVVIVLGPHFAGGFVARDRGDGGPDAERRFEYAVTHDRNLVVSAARALMSRIGPSPSAPRRFADGSNPPADRRT